ncbi:GGDEF domain-containing protein [Actinoplanes sp. NEAU-A12]|uniref:GGDEF domain-containing protein n=1 Tax=Actinoplanes sandaracinus TaxID=3045177 RepID=A0ABT6WK87_9ACTN|nr:GGDEF domain-containing protein [Actinoplanes sandaracinus]MDI6100128.1 GGDEF domain-containing protein [Actinoplanes sandaracinus]
MSPRLARPPAWLAFLLFNALAVTVYLLLGTDGVMPLLYMALMIVAVVVAAVAIRRRRPEDPAAWWLLTGGLAASIAGDLGHAVQEAMGRDAEGSLADVFYLVGYLMELTALLRMVRRRAPGRDLGSLVDALIVVGAFVLPVWVFLIRPLAEDAGLSLLGRLTAVGIPAFDLLLLGLLVWLLTSGVRTASFMLLAGSLGTFLATDFLFAFAGDYSLTASPALIVVLTVTYLFAYALFTAAVLHPSAGRVTGPAPDVRPVGHRRLVTQAVATLIAPGLLAWESQHGRVEHAFAIAAGCMVMFLLVVLRMSLLVRQVQAQSAQLADQARALNELAYRDPLTGVANRRAWTAVAEAVLSRSERDGSPVSVVILDLDHFKRYNDTRGHQAGDLLLKEAGAAWSGGVRAGDHLARYGGEEFVVLMPGTATAEAVALADRLRALTPGGCTFSAGVAQCAPGESIDATLERADQALYRAKENGRDRVEAARSVHPLVVG